MLCLGSVLLQRSVIEQLDDMPLSLIRGYLSFNDSGHHREVAF